MKRIKIIVSLILIFIGQIFIGEISLFYLDNFANEIAYTTIILQPGMSADTMKHDVIEASRSNNVDFFVVKNDVININRKNIIVYQNDNKVKQWLFENKKIQEKEYSSLFLGNTGIVFEKYENISESDLKVNNIYYVIGEAGNINSFKMELIDKYAGNHPVFPSGQNQFTITVFGIWTIIFGICIVFSIIYIQTRKKDSFIKIAYGEKPIALVLKEAVLDFIFITLIAVIQQKLLISYMNTELFNGEFYVMLTMFSLINVIIYFSLFKVKIKKIYENRIRSTTSLLYLLRVISVALVSIVITMNIAMIKEAVEFISQEKFFKEHKDYYYTNLGYIPREGLYGNSETTLVEDSARIKEIFYKKNYEEFEPMILVSFGEISSTDVIFANHNSISYLKDEITSFNINSIDDKCYYILPEAMKEKEKIIQSLDLRLENYMGDSQLKKREIFYYKENVNIINIHDLLSLNSKKSKNPIVILDNSAPTFVEKEIKGNPFKTTFDRDIMYKLNENSFNEFIEEYELTSEIHGKSNVYEVYLQSKLTMQRVLKMAFVISVILIFFEITVLLTLIKLDFKLNAYEISIKKILGYGRFERYSKLVIYSIIGSAIAMIAFIIVNFYIKMFPMLYGILVIFTIFVIDQLLIAAEIKKIERRNLHLVLKGEFR